MKTRATILHSLLLQSSLLALITLFVRSVYAQPAPTLWTGPNTNFTQSAANPTDILVLDKVALTRNGNMWLYNPYVDSGPATGTPSDTEWAFGSLPDYNSLSYQSFDSYRCGPGCLETVLVTTPPSPMVVHLVNENIYLQLTFSAWPAGGGFFAYTRSTPAAVAPTPTVSITNPAPSAVFAAPANVKVSASASVTSGAVTNVSFFANSSLLGSSKASPFSITTSSLGAGPYGLTAVATAAGVSGTSSVVNISVVTPVVTSLSGSSEAKNQFSFSYSVNPGLKYVVQSSSNMFDWTALGTNVPSSNPAFFTNPVAEPDSFYRVGRMPNP